MAAKKKGRSAEGSVPPWLGVLVALLIAAVAAFALLSVEHADESKPLPKLADDPESPSQHDRDQIDEKSREQLRDILRAADNGS